MSVLRPVLAALAVLLAASPAALAQVHLATPAGTLDAALAADGPPLGADVEPGAGPGDGSVTVRQQVRAAEVTWRGAPGPARLDAEVGLRGLAVHSPALPLLAELVAHAGDARPAALAGAPWPYVGAEGVDFTSDLLVHRHPGDPGWPMVLYPDTWYDLDWGVGYDGLSLPSVVQESSDAEVGNVADSAAYACHATDVEFALGLAAACDSPAGRVRQATPEVRLVGNLVDVRLAALPAREGSTPAAGGAGPAPGRAAPGDAPRSGAAARAAPLPVALRAGEAPLPAAGLPGALPGAPLATQSSGGAEGSLQALAGALPAALAALALLAPVWALYRRLSPPDALLHPLREEMLQRIRAHPGIHESQLAREMGLRHTHVQYHLRVLREGRIVEERRFGGLKCLFEVGTLSEAEKGLAMNERGRGPEVLRGIVAEPGITQRDLARKLGMSESSVKWHLDRLTQAGLVRTDRARGSKRAWPAAASPALPAPGALPVLAALPLPRSE